MSQYSSASGLWDLYSTDDIYPVIKHNNAYLAGKSGYIRSSPSLIIISLWALWWLLCGSFGLYLVLNRVSHQTYLEQNYKAVQARITNHHITTTTRTVSVTNKVNNSVTTNKTVTDTNYYFTYTFVATPAGAIKNKTYSKEVVISYLDYKDYPINSLITIFYLPSNPDTSEIPVSSQDLDLNFVLVGAIYTLGIIVVLFGILTWRLNRFLVRKGVLLPAEAVSVDTVYEIEEDDGWWKTWKQGIEVTYRFTTTEGQVITRSKRLKYNAYTDNISESSRLIVLYHDKRRFRLL